MQGALFKERAQGVEGEKKKTERGCVRRRILWPIESIFCTKNLSLCLSENRLLCYELTVFTFKSRYLYRSPAYSIKEGKQPKDTLAVRTMNGTHCYLVLIVHASSSPLSSGGMLSDLLAIVLEVRRSSRAETKKTGGSISVSTIWTNRA